MKYKSMLSVIAGAGLVLGSFSATAGSGWAFNYTGETVEQTAKAAKKKSSGGPGWAFSYTGETVEQNTKSAKKKGSGGSGWAFDHPHEPVHGASSRS